MGCVPAVASVKIMYEPQPTPRKISALSEKVIRAFACGHNHTLALDTEQAAYTWGDASIYVICVRLNVCNAPAL